VNRQAQAIVMLLFGGAILRASLTDMYLRYVKAGLQPFLIAAGVLLVAAAAMTLWYDLRRRPPAGEHDTPHADHDDHAGDAGDGHAHHEPRVGWLLLLPVLGLVLVAPPALGSYAAGQAGSVPVAQNPDSGYAPLPAGDPVSLSLMEYASRAIFDDNRSLDGRAVRLTGFVTDGPDGQPMLARMVLSCCAADGRPIKVGLSGDVPAGVPADTWVTITGGFDPRQGKDPVNEATVPYLKVSSWQQTTAPKDPYE
jgi:uncharacterized repeat protein (TIGR03943 family)